MGPEIANVRAIIGLLWPTVFLAKMSILNTVHSLLGKLYFPKAIESTILKLPMESTASETMIQVHQTLH